MLKMLYITMVLFLHCQLLKLLNLKVIFLLDNLIRLHAGQRRFKQLSLFIWATNWEFNWIQNLQKCGFYDTDTDNTCFRVLSASLKIPVERHNPDRSRFAHTYREIQQSVNVQVMMATTCMLKIFQLKYINSMQ